MLTKRSQSHCCAYWRESLVETRMDTQKWQPLVGIADVISGTFLILTVINPNKG